MKKLHEKNHVYLFEVYYKGRITFEVFRTKLDDYPVNGCFIFNSYEKAFSKFNELIGKKDENKVSESEGVKTPKLDKRKNIRDNGNKSRERRTYIIKTDGSVRNGHRFNR